MAAFCNFIIGVLQGGLGIVAGFLFLTFISYLWLSWRLEKDERYSFWVMLEGVFIKYLNPNPDKKGNPVFKGSVNPFEEGAKHPRNTEGASTNNREKTIADIRRQIESDGKKFQELSSATQEEFLNFFYLLSMLEVLQEPSLSKGVRYYFYEDDRQVILETAVPEITSKKQKEALKKIEGASQRWERNEYEDRIHYKLLLKRIGNKVVCR